MIHSTRPPIALVMNSRPSSQRSGVVLRSSKLFAVNQGLHTLPFATPEKIPNRSPPGSFPSSPMACSLYVLSDSSNKTHRTGISQRFSPIHF
jgi:hypothetical protein